MNKKKSIFIFSLVLILNLVLNLGGVALATDLSYIDTDLYIDGNGDGLITMKWKYSDDQGTEHYIPIKKEGLELTDLKVSKDGQEYETVDNWDVNASIEDKAYKAALVDKGDEYEVCWGISEYGESEYTISYRVKNIIKRLTDAEMLHYRFVNDGLSEAPERVSLNIHGDQAFTEDILMWGFGLNGDIQLVDGNIQLNSLESLDSSNYVHVLLKFPLDYFNVREESFIDRDFESFKEEAFSGSDYEDYEDGQVVEESSSSIGKIFLILIFLPIFLIFLVISAALRANKKEKINLDTKALKGQYFSAVPYEGNPLDLYYILENIGLTEYKNLVSYFFLKWIREGILVKTEYESGFLFKKEKSALKIEKEVAFNNKFEERFFKMIKESAGSDRVLQENEFSKWMENNYNRFDNLLEDIKSESKLNLISQGYLEERQEKTLFFKSSVINVSPRGQILAENLFKFKNYLYDYSLINERDSYNVHIWDDLMLYASLFGITERVQKEFSKLYPEYMNETDFDFTSYYLMNMYTRSFVTSYNNAGSIDSAAVSGFGGGTSFGGGGGGFGGGSGGGTR